MPSASLWPFTGLAPVCPSLSCTGQPRPGHTTPDVLSAWLRRITTLNLLVKLSLMLHGCLCHKDTLLAHIPLGVHQEPCSLFCKAAFQSVNPQPVWVGAWGSSSPGAGLGITLCSALEIPVDPLQQPLKIPLNGSAAIWFINHASSANLPRIHSVPSSWSLMKMSKSTGPSINPWSPELVMRLQLDFVPMTPTLQAQQFRLFSIHLTVLLSNCDSSLCQ